MDTRAPLPATHDPARCSVCRAAHDPDTCEQCRAGYMHTVTIPPPHDPPAAPRGTKCASQVTDHCPMPPRRGGAVLLAALAHAVSR
jgi:hypothetical protein